MQRTGQPVLATARQVLGHYRSPLALAGSALMAGAEALVHPALIVPVVVAASPAAVTPIGLLATVALAGWAFPQLFTEARGLGASRLNWSVWLVAARAAVALIIASVFLVTGSVAVGALVVLLAIFWILGGLVSSGRPASILADYGEDIPAPIERYQFWGGVAAILAGLLAVRLLGPDGPSFPTWAILLSLAVAVLLGAAALLMWQGETRATDGRGPLWTHLSLAPSLLIHGRRLRRYAVFRVLLLVAALADPFYLVYAIQTLDLPLQSAGLYLALFALVRTGAGLAFPRLVTAGFARPLAQLAAFARLLMPLLALVLPLILAASPISGRTDLDWIGPVAFAGLVMLYAWATGSAEATDAAYLRDALAPGHRPAMHAFWLVLLTVMSVVFLIASAIVERWGFQVLLFVAFGASLLTVFVSGLLLSVPPEDTRELTTSGALPTFRESADW